MCVDLELMQVPFFSVIMCTYQRAALIPRAIDSLLAQTETDWELLVVDDGSTDDTEHIVQKYGAMDRRIRYIRQDHGGSARARNTGIDVAQGLFVTFLDSDDEYSLDHLASRRTMLLSHPSIQLLHGGVTIIGDEYVIDKNDPSVKIHLSECVVGGTFIVRRSVFQDIGGFDLVPYAEDALFFERASTKGIAIAQTDHPTYIYHRDSPDALTVTYGTT